MCIRDRAVAAGCGVIWAKSAMVGTPPIAGPMTSVLSGRVLDRYDQGGEHKVRLDIATREPGSGRAIRVRLSMPMGADVVGLAEGAVVRMRARLVPPADAALPGAYDAARQAWFDGIAATGTVTGPLTVVSPAPGDSWLARLRHALSAHVHAQVKGSAGGIAAAFASGDRGGISLVDEQAMRDSGLTHLLSVSGLHVSAVIAGAYVVAARLLALFPWLALRMRLPLVSGCVGAGVGLAYTLLTGAQVPTLRSLLGALLVLAALALGRRPFSLRLLAVVAICIMALWPEAVVGPSFQMSFGAVLVIGVLSDCAPVRAFLAPREEGRWRRMGRHLFMILLTGMVIDLALMPVALFHFHRAGIYGAMANLIAIPLTTFVSMPSIAAGLGFDLLGLGGPAWWVCDQSLNLLLAIARWVAARPDAVTVMPAMGGGRFVVVMGAMLWLALWHGRVRMWGLIPAVLAVASMVWLTAPDMLISGDGRTIGITGIPGQSLLILRDGQSQFARDTMMETAGMTGLVMPLIQWPAARCSDVACQIQVVRGGRSWHVLILQGRKDMAQTELARACSHADIVIARQALDPSCRPAMLMADGALLQRSGGLALDLRHGTITNVAEQEGDHPWWRAHHPAF